MKQVFHHLRAELGIEIPRVPKRLPYVPTEEEIRRDYEVVWQARRTGNVIMIKTLLYIGVRVNELVGIRLDDLDFDSRQVRINRGNGDKDHVVPSPRRSRRLLPFTPRRCGPRGPPTCSSRPGSGCSHPAFGPVTRVSR